ncbi:MAG: hemolysin family protein [Alphaproteobacteria bacterium]
MSDTLTNLLIATFLLAANGFYVAAEFALVKSRGFRVEALAEKKRFGAKLAQDMLTNIEAYLACCQLGITMASLGLGWVGEPTVSAILLPLLQPLEMSEGSVHVTAFIVGFVTFSSLHIVLGEQVPKTIAIRKPEPVAQWIAYPLYASFILFYPLNWLLNTTSRAILRGLGVKEAPHQEVLTFDEIEGLVEASAEHGEMEESHAGYIHSLFRFADLTVRDVMVHRKNMIVFDANDAPDEIVEQMLTSPHTRFPISRDNPENIVGILHMKELLRFLIRSRGSLEGFNVLELTTAPWFVPETTTLEEQLAAFRERHAHFALVVDEYGTLQGLVTLEDILEEVFGDIAELHDQRAGTGIRRQADGSYNVDGWIPVRDLNRELEWTLPEEEATTVAGLVINATRTIPEVGQVFSFYGFKFEILRRQRNQITALRITPPQTVPAS